MKVIKFGGSSLASATQLKKVLDIVKSDDKRKFVVVSAPGKRSTDDEKVTDMLIQYAEAYLANKEVNKYQEKIINRYADMVQELHLDSSVLTKISDSIKKLCHLDKTHPHRVLDTFKASGEDNNAKLVAAYFSSNGLPATYVNPKQAGLLVSDEPGCANVLDEAYEQLSNLHHIEGTLVIPGFFGYTKKGDICTFSRGGSDITGSIIAAGVHAELYENFTDVDAIYAAHPGIIDEPKKIDVLTFREMRELSYAGFGVFHDEALIPAFKANIPVVIKNTNNPSAPGTNIVASRATNPHESVIGIAGDAGFSSIYISKYLMNREVGFGRHVLAIFESLNLNYEHMPSGIDDISIVLRESQITSELEQILLERLKKELCLDEVKVRHGLSMIVVVGEGMKSRVGIAAKGTCALAKAGINLEMINQGSSEVSIIFGIKKEDEIDAIKALYHAYFNE
ncbi:aspartate kinase [Vagococcus entomophilus]|uniref:Aspartokinase n=1 Tax=Vagococcus entomophilus TaxID=1160095 RepID=A0A430AIR1_9ENTE|nr:aspartate kinase [Vagococcus entomophilus]RSU07992.1 aspartate kinase [Vagococcus entomophilus]